MKRYISTLIILIVAIASMCAKGNNKRIIFTTTPQMHCESCENKIQGNLRFVKGVKIIMTNIPQQTVTITYDSTKCTKEDLVKAFNKIKYEVKEVNPADLPECCSGSIAGGNGENHQECEEKKQKSENK